MFIFFVVRKALIFFVIRKAPPTFAVRKTVNCFVIRKALICFGLRKALLFVVIRKALIFFVARKALILVVVRKALVCFVCPKGPHIFAINIERLYNINNVFRQARIYKAQDNTPPSYNIDIITFKSRFPPKAGGVGAHSTEVAAFGSTSR